MLSRFFVFLLCCFCSLSIPAQRDSLSVKTDTDTTEISTNKTLVDSVLAYAEKYLGRPYGFGSVGTKSFDCSGFVMHVYGKYGVTLPHGSATQAIMCKEIKLKKVVPGDLVFFAGRKISKKSIGHVAIVKEVKDGEIFLIHATVQAGVIVEQLSKSDYFSKRFIKAGRLELPETKKVAKRK